MLILDCHDVERTYSSLTSIFGPDRNEIDSFLDSCDPEVDKVPDPERWANNVFNKFKEQASVNTAYDGTCWFHFTRLPAGTDFSKGLRPLREALPDILDWLGAMVDSYAAQDEWETFRTAILQGRINSGTLRFRKADSYQQGPFGGLIRDFAFHASSKRDYFRKVPEAIEDLISAIESRFGHDLTSLYLQDSNSFIVKFQTLDSPVSNLSAALYYLLCMRRGSGLIDDCITYCSMHGVTVPPSDIIEVEEFPIPPAIIPAT